MVAFFKSDQVAYRPLVSTPRSLSVKLLALFAVLSVLYVGHSLIPSDYKPDLSSLRFPASRVRGTCPPRSYAAGKWVPKPPPTNRTDFKASSDAFEFLGFEGCASTREIFWHLAADKERLWDRFPGVSSWRWQPASDCDIRDLDPAVLVKDLVEKGGWLLIGGESAFSSCDRRPQCRFDCACMIVCDEHVSMPASFAISLAKIAIGRRGAAVAVSSGYISVHPA